MVRSGSDAAAHAAWWIATDVAARMGWPTPIMKRQLTVVNGGQPCGMSVDLAAPARRGDHEWQCRYTLHWPDGVKEGAAYGIDAVQALILALNMVAVRLCASDAHEEQRLFWESVGDGYGFPLSATIRDLAQGADRSP